MGHLDDDPRIDLRLKAVFGQFTVPPLSDVGSREELLALERTPEAIARNEAIRAFTDSFGDEDVAPSSGLRISTVAIRSEPDGVAINLQVVRPDDDDVRPCVYYLHGGGMMYMSCFDGNYRAWARMIARQGVVVVMPDFRNCLAPSSTPQVAPFPAGLEDCESGLDWLLANAGSVGADSSQVVVAGESGGGNLALSLAIRLNRLGRSSSIKGVYAMCPIIAGRWPHPDHPSSVENDGIFLNLANNRIIHAYGVEAWRARNPEAWPGMAGVEHVRGLPPTVISVNECDPLRDEGVAFYRLLLKAGVRARCRTIMGTTHGAEVFPSICPEISTDAARHIADFAGARGGKPTR